MRYFLITVFILILNGYSVFGEETKKFTQVDLKNREFLNNYCKECHNAKKKKGKFRVDDLSYLIDSNETAEKWQKILNSLNGSEMPPEDEKQPGDREKVEFLDGLAKTMVNARKLLSDQHGAITMRRLNRREYGNTLRELLGVEVNVSELPSDTDNGGFDTVGSNLFMSSNQIEQYLSLGREALEEAFVWKANAGIDKVKRVEAEYLSESYKKYVEKTIDAKERAEKWVAAFNEAAAKPENKETLTELKKSFKQDWAIRRNWSKIKGAPAPEEFGFKTKENNSDKANSALKPFFLPYHQHYLKQKKIDSGAYLTVPTVHPSQLPTGYLMFHYPWGWPPGNYIVRIRAGADQSAPLERRTFEFGLNAPHGHVISTHEVTATIEDPQIIEIPITFTTKHTDRENREIFIREQGSDYYLSSPRQTFRKAKDKNGIGPEFVLWVDWLEIERIPNKDQEQLPAIAALKIPLDDKTDKVDKAALRDSLEVFAKVAFRGEEPPAAYLDRLVNIYNTKRSNGVKHREALKDTLAVVLASPMFLYISEPKDSQKSRTLEGDELASRLSYFLWGAPADEKLLALGKSGKLMDKNILISETRRLLDDPRSKDFVHAFTYQWLGLDRLDFFQADIKKFLEFDDSVKLAVKNEVYESVLYLLKENLSLKNLLKADYAVVNNVLAKFYGIEGVKGDEFRPVKLSKDSPRGGLLGMAAIHLMGSNGVESNPVERGAWVLRKLMNNPPPPAPANVPLITRLASKPLTTNERLKAHQELPQCKSCHRKIDPIGLGLENFDAVGRWRTKNEYIPFNENGKPDKKHAKKWEIETAGKIHNGPAFKNYFELRDIIAKEKGNFAKGFSSALIEYALGRPAGVSDELLIEKMVAQSKNLAIREFIYTLVTSEKFRTK